jgi:hypothetical protein
LYQGGAAVLHEIPNVKETEHLQPYFPRIKDAVFESEALYLDWRGRHDDQGSLKSKVADGLLWLPSKKALWLVELEWKLGSNYLQQVQTFAESKVDRKKLWRELSESLEANRESGQLSSDLAEARLELTMERHFKGSLLQPNMWVVLGHEGENIDQLLCEYIKVTEAFFKGREYLVTMVRWFSNHLTEFFLLDNYRRTQGEIVRVLGRTFENTSHTALLVPLNPHALELPKTRSESSRRDEQKLTTAVPLGTKAGYSPGRVPVVHKANEVWGWFEDNYPAVKQENIWLRIQLLRFQLDVFGILGARPEVYPDGAMAILCPDLVG